MRIEWKYHGFDQVIAAQLAQISPGSINLNTGAELLAFLARRFFSNRLARGKHGLVWKRDEINERYVEYFCEDREFEGRYLPVPCFNTRDGRAIKVLASTGALPSELLLIEIRPLAKHSNPSAEFSKILHLCHVCDFPTCRMR
nr:hypothetical protein [Actinomyces mediterranea]